MPLTPDEIKDLLGAPTLECDKCNKKIVGDKFIQEHLDYHARTDKIKGLMDKVKDEKSKKEMDELKKLLEANFT